MQGEESLSRGIRKTQGELGDACCEPDPSNAKPPPGTVFSLQRNKQPGTQYSLSQTALLEDNMGLRPALKEETREHTSSREHTNDGASQPHDSMNRLPGLLQTPALYRHPTQKGWGQCLNAASHGLTRLSLTTLKTQDGLCSRHLLLKSRSENPNLRA